MSRISGRLRFRKDDPLRDLHVPKRQRLDNDPHDGSDDGTDPGTGEAGTADIDRDDVRERGDVVSQRDLDPHSRHE